MIGIVWPRDNSPEGETPEEGLQRWGKIFNRRMNMLNWGFFACIILAIGAMFLNWLVVALVFVILMAVVFIVLIPGPFVALHYKKKYRGMISR